METTCRPATKKEELLNFLDNYCNDCKAFTVVVTTPNCELPEEITNPVENLKVKRDFYSKAYTDDLTHAMNDKVKIVGWYNEKKIKPIDIVEIAKICHNVNKAYCESIGDLSQPKWIDAPEWQKNSAIDGVNFHVLNDVTPEQSHENWLKVKEQDGWVYGEVKDPEKKTHPCFRPYSELPLEQRIKDYLFKAVVDSFKG